MLSFSSVSLANAKVKYALFAASYALAIFLYWPSFNGLPIWDDQTFWFSDPVMLPDYPFTQIWLRFTWPFSVSLQKILFNVFGENWWVYHAISFAIHGFNAWLVYHLTRILRMGRASAYLGFIFFLIHPASVIAVAWMIQIKTLVCFTLSLGTIIFFVKARRPRDYVIAVILFTLSVLCKSSSLPLPLVLIFFLGKNWKTKKALTLIPFFLVSVYGYYRLTNSVIAAEGIKTATQVATKTAVIPEEPVIVSKPAPVEVKPVEVKPVEVAPEIVKTEPGSLEESKQLKVEEKIAVAPEVAQDASFKPQPDEPLVMNGPEFTPPAVEYPEAKKWEAPVEPTLSNADDSKIVAHVRLIVKTLYYYFWQSFMPVDNAPVKGLNPFPPKPVDYIHLLFLGIIIVLTWGTHLLAMLIAGHILLLPYVGIIPAPYMNVTWVSDQHIYLALPCFILMSLGAFEKVRKKWILAPIVALVIFFAFETRKTTPYYTNNFVFYEASINSNYNNIPLIYNLAILYLLADRQNDALDLMESVMSAAEEEKYIKDNRYYPFLIHLYSQVAKR